MSLQASSSSTELFGGSPLVSGSPPWEGATHPVQPTNFWGDSARPLPTNVWWQNVVLGQGEGVATVNPYIVKTKVDGLHVCLPTRQTHENYVAAAYL